MNFLKNITFVLLMSVVSNSYSQWTQKGLDIDGEAANDISGQELSTSSDGLTIAIGATGNDNNGSNSGQVKIYEFVSGVWTQKGLDINGGLAGDYSGSSVSISDNGNVVAIGAVYNSDNGSNSGQVRVYEFISGVWTQKGLDLNGDAANDFFGTSVSINGIGDIIAIGASSNDLNGTSAGQVKIYQYSTGAWNQLGSDLLGSAAGMRFGRSVSLNDDGTILAVGAYDSDLNGNPSGKCRVFEFTLGNWSQIGADIIGDVANDFFGSSVDINATGNTVVIGAYKSNSFGSIAGLVRVYENIANVWTQKGTDIGGEAAGDYFGCAVSISADGLKIAAGGYGNDANGGESGHGRVYEFSSNNWVQIGTDMDGEAALDYSGYAIDLNDNGTMVSIGAYANDGFANSAGQVRTYYFCTTINTTDTQVACDSFLWIDGNTYFNNNTTATYTLTSLNGCDSLITLNLTINTVDVSLTASGENISAFENGAAYQWLDCSNNFAELTNENAQNFTASINGSYAVEIVKNGCTDTSICVLVEGLNINEYQNANDIFIYPNPNNGNFIIESDQQGNIFIEIININGELIKRINSNGNQINKIQLDVPNGMYIIKIISKEAIKSYKVLIQ